MNERLLILAMKHCPRDHHDWEEIEKIYDADMAIKEYHIDEDCVLKDLDFSLMPVRQEKDKIFVWYSICSKHRWFNHTCNLCRVGNWIESKIDDYWLNK